MAGSLVDKWAFLEKKIVVLTTQPYLTLSPYRSWSLSGRRPWRSRQSQRYSCDPRRASSQLPARLLAAATAHAPFVVQHFGDGAPFRRRRGGIVFRVVVGAPIYQQQRGTTKKTHRQSQKRRRGKKASCDVFFLLLFYENLIEVF